MIILFLFQLSFPDPGVEQGLARQSVRMEGLSRAAAAAYVFCMLDTLTTLDESHPVPTLTNCTRAEECVAERR